MIIGVVIFDSWDVASSSVYISVIKVSQSRLGVYDIGVYMKSICHLMHFRLGFFVLLVQRCIVQLWTKLNMQEIWATNLLSATVALTVINVVYCEGKRPCKYCMWDNIFDVWNRGLSL